MKKTSTPVKTKASAPRGRVTDTLSAQNIGILQKTSHITTIYVGNLKYTITEQDLKAVFESFGCVNYVQLVKDRKTKKNKGFAFIQMPYKNDALKAIEHFNGREFDGRTLKVSIASEKNPEKIIDTRTPKKSKEEAAKIEMEIQAAEKEANEARRPSRRKRDKGLKILFNHLGK